MTNSGDSFMRNLVVVLIFIPVAAILISLTGFSADKLGDDNRTPMAPVINQGHDLSETNKIVGNASGARASKPTTKQRPTDAEMQILISAAENNPFYGLSGDALKDAIRAYVAQRLNQGVPPSQIKQELGSYLAGLKFANDIAEKYSNK